MHIMIDANIFCVREDMDTVRYYVHSDHMQSGDEELVKLNFECDLYY